MAKTSEARAKLSLDSSSFEKSADAVEKAAAKMSNAITTAFAVIGGAALASFGANTFSAFVKSIYNVLELGEQTANAGQKAQRAAGQFYLLNTAIEKGLSLKTVSNTIGENAVVLNRSADVFRDVALKLYFVGEKVRGFWLGLVDRLAPVLSKLLDGALAQSLVQAGQRFGEVLANGIKAIYQLAEDGKLWGAFKQGFELVVAYMAERFLWLVNLLYEALKVTLVSALQEFFTLAWQLAKNFASGFADALKNGLSTAFEEALKVLIPPLGLGLDGLKEGIKAGEEGAKPTIPLEYALQTPGRKQPGYAAQKTPETYIDKIADIFKKNQFNSTSGLDKQIKEFGEVLSGAIDKFNKNNEENPATTFENNSRRTASGVDSLQAIGGGGNVYFNLSLLDVQKQQLVELKDINKKLSVRQAVTSIVDIATAGVSGISRALTGNVVE